MEDDGISRAIARADALRPFVKDAGDRALEKAQAPVERCRRYRRRILEISRQVTAAHVAPAFSCLEIVDTLYHDIMRPDDIFIMSKGHGCLAQYVVLEDMKWERERECGRCGGSGFDSPGTGYGNVCGECGGLRYSGPRLLDSYCQLGGKLGAHPDYDPGIGIYASTGSLGHGLGIAAGQALAEQQKNSGARVFVLLSDGECQEGSTWEAAMVAANLQLHNLVALVDANDWGGMDRMSKAFPHLDPLALKFVAFGWGTEHTNFGHDRASILHCLRGVTLGLTPAAVVCRTVKGKGVSFMEDQPIWHYRSPSDAEYKQAMEELADGD